MVSYFISRISLPLKVVGVGIDRVLCSNGNIRIIFHNNADSFVWIAFLICLKFFGLTFCDFSELLNQLVIISLLSLRMN
jgi:hypothetical protein